MKGIEISYGAKDSELQEWEYNIPEGYTAEIKDGKVIIKKDKPKLSEFERELVETIEEFLNRAVVTDSVQDYVTKVAPNLLDLARKEVINDAREEAYLKGKEDGKDELLAELEKPRWKPSKEQIKALEAAEMVYSNGYNKTIAEGLSSLLADLKKLLHEEQI